MSNDQDTAPEAATEDHLAPVPEDAPEAAATGYAVYDRTLGQFVGPVSTSKPSRSDADKAVRKGHRAAVVRV